MLRQPASRSGVALRTAVASPTASMLQPPAARSRHRHPEAYSAPATREAPMSEAEPVLSLVRDIYDAALDPALWGDVLGKARDFVGGSAAAPGGPHKSRPGEIGDEHVLLRRLS